MSQQWKTAMNPDSLWGARHLQLYVKREATELSSTSSEYETCLRPTTSRLNPSCPKHEYSIAVSHINIHWTTARWCCSCGEHLWDTDWISLTMQEGRRTLWETTLIQFEGPKSKSKSPNQGLNPSLCPALALFARCLWQKPSGTVVVENCA